MILTIVRHGQSVTNVEGKLAGGFDTPLTDYGISQAKIVAKRLENKTFDVGISSDLQRAKDTLDIILTPHSGIPVENLKMINERDYKQYANILVSKICSDLGCKRDDMYDTLVSKGFAETNQVYYGRMEKFIGYLLENHKGKSVLLVNHKFFLFNFIKKIVSLEAEGVYPDNCSITTIDLSNGLPGKIISYNDTTHLI